MDIKKAFDSVTTARVFKNFQGAILKYLKLRAPTLQTEEEKLLFLRALTHLCVHQNQLPQ